MQVKKLSENATLPRRQTEGSVGYDLYAAENGLVPQHGRALIKTDISLAIIEGHYGQIKSRSSLSLRNSIDVAAGVLDSDFVCAASFSYPFNVYLTLL